MTCLFSALSYAELASTIPVSGSAYTYGYATLGELSAWIIGWDLILEYGVSVAAVAVGWGGYLQSLLDSLFGISLPDSLAGPPGDGGTFNLPAVVPRARRRRAAHLRRARERADEHGHGVRQGRRSSSSSSSSASPRSTATTSRRGRRTGRSGTVDAAALIFFAYIGFDAVSTAGEEAKDPQRDLPIAHHRLAADRHADLHPRGHRRRRPAAPRTSSPAPRRRSATRSRRAPGSTGRGDLLSFGALVAITSVTLTILYGQTRIFFAMCRDGLLPRRSSRASARARTPVCIDARCSASSIALIAAFVPLAEIAKLVNIGTLFAFVIVNIGVIVLRRTQPDLERGFRVPFVPVFPLIGTALCIYLMTPLEARHVAALRRSGWSSASSIYFVYGRTHSRLQRGEGADVGRADEVA